MAGNANRVGRSSTSDGLHFLDALFAFHHVVREGPSIGTPIKIHGQLALPHKNHANHPFRQRWFSGVDRNDDPILKGGRTLTVREGGSLRLVGILASHGTDAFHQRFSCSWPVGTEASADHAQHTNQRNAQKAFHPISAGISGEAEPEVNGGQTSVTPACYWRKARFNRSAPMAIPAGSGILTQMRTLPPSWGFTKHAGFLESDKTQAI